MSLLNKAGKVFPRKGTWSEQEYLSLSTNRPVEFTDGVLEVLPMPTPSHQMIVAFLYDSLKAFVARRRAGTVFFAAVPVHLRAGKYREPDIVFVRRRNRRAIQPKHIQRGDLVVEVVSPDDPARDWVKKVAEYAKAGIPEYWIVDPKQRKVAVFTLGAGRDAYALHGEFRPGRRATSVLLPGFSVSVSKALAAAERIGAPRL
ncbi:MAG: Uma2 family endonuclease [Planctomycetes bacterium]|nr:Uma2 family endonuclease [Planctomycetota bacterium]